MEYEFRTYFPLSNYFKLFQDVSFIFDWENKTDQYERTCMVDAPNLKDSFYRKDIDGRLRLRRYLTIKEFDRNLEKINLEKLEYIEMSSYGKISWKKRLTSNKDLNVEEEIEYKVSYAEIENCEQIFLKILKCPIISSYEKLRSVFINNEVEISINIYPFGISFEIESLSKNSDDIIIKYKKLLNMIQIQNSNLSCDDMYFKLCKNFGCKIKKDICFSDLEMPMIEDVF